MMSLASPVIPLPADIKEHYTMMIEQLSQGIDLLYKTQTEQSELLSAMLARAVRLYQKLGVVYVQREDYANSLKCCWMGLRCRVTAAAIAAAAAAASGKPRPPPSPQTASSKHVPIEKAGMTLALRCAGTELMCEQDDALLELLELTGDVFLYLSKVDQDKLSDLWKVFLQRSASDATLVALADNFNRFLSNDGQEVPASSVGSSLATPSGTTTTAAAATTTTTINSDANASATSTTLSPPKPILPKEWLSQWQALTASILHGDGNAPASLATGANSSSSAAAAAAAAASSSAPQSSSPSTTTTASTYSSSSSSSSSTTTTSSLSSSSSSSTPSAAAQQILEGFNSFYSWSGLGLNLSIPKDNIELLQHCVDLYEKAIRVHSAFIVYMCVFV